MALQASHQHPLEHFDTTPAYLQEEYQHGKLGFLWLMQNFNDTYRHNSWHGPLSSDLYGSPPAAYYYKTDFRVPHSLILDTTHLGFGIGLCSVSSNPRLQSNFILLNILRKWVTHFLCLPPSEPSGQFDDTMSICHDTTLISGEILTDHMYISRSELHVAHYLQTWQISHLVQQWSNGHGNFWRRSVQI